MNHKPYKIFLTGGGTGGPVTPLLAIVDEFKLSTSPGEFNFLWIGTKDGVEVEMVKKAGVAFKPILSGKLRRYFSWRNFSDPFFIFAGFFQSLYLISKFHPNLIMSAGGFVSVPVVWAGWLLRVPIIIHQQDIRPGLANKLMSPFAKIVTVTFEKSFNDYPRKAIWTGNPIRQEFLRRNKLTTANKSGLPTLLILGGGTGSTAINELVWNSLDELLKFCKIIHLTGKQKSGIFEKKYNNYIHHEFLTTEEIADSYANADLVISRCGMSVLTELSYLGKPTILIPLPNSHQVDNAMIFKLAKGAIVLEQKNLIPRVFIDIIKNSISNPELLKELGLNIKNIIKTEANSQVAQIIKSILAKQQLA